MIPRSFEYVSPTTLEQALTYLDEYGSNSKILAGGQSLIPLMKLRLASPKYLIDINRISGLDYILEGAEKDSSSIRIGSMTRHHSIETSSLLWRRAPIMPEAASMIGDPQVRNNGTLGGSLVHADPAADWGAVIIALGAKLKLRSSSGERRIDSDSFFVDSLTSAAKGNEILTEISFPVEKIAGGSYAKLERKSTDFATVGVAAQLALDASGNCERVGIGLASVAPTSVRATKAESILRWHEPTKARIEDAAKAAAEESRPMDDPLRGSAAYKRAMVRVFTERALTRALERAKRTEER